MNTASLELCKELYELSGWNPESFYYTTDRPYADAGYGRQGYVNTVPAYDLGYLLRKLPAQTLLLKYSDVYKATMPFNGDATADTPEDAAAKLCIELFKQGILTKA